MRQRVRDLGYHHHEDQVEEQFEPRGGSTLRVISQQFTLPRHGRYYRLAIGLQSILQNLEGIVGRVPAVLRHVVASCCRLKADVVEQDMEYLYTDGEFWHFMLTDGSFEQYAADAKAVGDTVKWLKEQDVYTVTLYNGAPLTVTPPNFVELEVVDTDPGMKGDTAQGGSKPATLSTGAVVNVPLFITIGEVLKVDTRSGEYVNRVKSS